MATCRRCWKHSRLQFDYSQLPIMHGEREVKGMISLWAHVGWNFQESGYRYSTGADSRRLASMSWNTLWKNWKLRFAVSWVTDSGQRLG